MNVIRWEPYRELSSLAERVNRAFGLSLPRARDEEISLGSWIPPVDIAEENDRIVLTAELPGFQPEQVEAQQAKIQALGEIAASAGMPLHHLAMQWVLREPAVTSAIIGARTVAQLDDTLACLEAGPLDADHLAAIEAACPPIARKEAEG